MGQAMGPGGRGGNMGGGGRGGQGEGGRGRQGGGFGGQKGGQQGGGFGGQKGGEGEGRGDGKRPMPCEDDCKDTRAACREKMDVKEGERPEHDKMKACLEEEADDTCAECLE